MMTAVQMLGATNTLQLALPEKSASPVTEISSMSIPKDYCVFLQVLPTARGWLGSGTGPAYLGPFIEGQGTPKGDKSVVPKGTAALFWPLLLRDRRKGAVVHKALAVI